MVSALNLANLAYFTMQAEEKDGYMGNLSQFLQRQNATLQAKEKLDKEKREKARRDKEEKEKEELERKLKREEKNSIRREKQRIEDQGKIKEGKQQKEEKLNWNGQGKINGGKQQEEKLNWKGKGKINGGKRQKEEKLNWKQERKIKQAKLQKEEEEQIIKGSSSAIPSTNIGFKMLQQMGYNPGLALGKDGQGRLEPIGIDIKRSRTGLGKDDVEKQKKIAMAKEMERNTQENRMTEQNMMSDFRDRRKQLWQSRKIMSTYKKVSATLAQLEGVDLVPDKDDKAKKQEEGVDEAEEDEEDEVTAEELLELLNRLRIEFNYCFYCGCQYESADALISNCPGAEEEDH